MDPYWEGWFDWMRAQAGGASAGMSGTRGLGLPGDWNGWLAPSHEFIFHFNRQPRKPNKTVESANAGETPAAAVAGPTARVHRKTGYGNAIQSHRIPDSVFRIMRHKGGWRCRIAPAVFPGGAGRGGSGSLHRSGNPVFEPFCGSAPS